MGYYLGPSASNLLINIIVAILGAFLAGYFLSPIFKVGTINDAITLPTMLATLLGSVILLAIVHLIRRGPQVDVTETTTSEQHTDR
ncbi:MAG: GlsB/YeaQ/YmgE family stress response membrane protein [Anaerolineales bacterium]|nr:GlsB/YeaQ/YmgE family stress response membrane protein [Anaerolineales bacterium]